MKVTDLDYFIEKQKVYVLEWLCDRVHGKNKHQNVIITDGKEGYGKSTLTAADAYYIGHRLRREVALFFDLEALKDYSVKTHDKVIIWDDAAFSALSLQAYDTAILELIKILLLARNRRHTYFINIQDMYMLKKDIVPRATCWNHVYSPDQKTLGSFTFYNEAQLNYLYGLYKTKKKKRFTPFSFRGKFTNVLYKIFSQEEYESLKDEAIGGIMTKKDEKEAAWKKKFNALKYDLSAYPDLSTKEKAKIMSVSERAVQMWAKKKRESNTEADSNSPNRITRINKKNRKYINPIKQDYLSLPLGKFKPMIPESKRVSFEQDLDF